ncbi:MAG TPA: hypothetical protein VGG01_10285 [Xanthobacteraceae bacterium]
MHGKWDLLIMAFVAASSWVLAENTHRIDLGAPDDVVAAAPACDVRANLYGWNQQTIMIVDEGFQVATDASPPPPSGCAHP